MTGRERAVTGGRRGRNDGKRFAGKGVAKEREREIMEMKRGDRAERKKVRKRQTERGKVCL